MYYLLAYALSSIFIYNTQAYISISSPRPIRGGNVTIYCNTSSTVAFYNPLIQGTSLAICSTLSNSSSCTPITFPPGEQTIYQSGTDGTISWVNILSLNRTRDQTKWRCQDSVNASKAEAIDLTVYTAPLAVRYVSPPPSSTDLGQTSLTLECQTDRCTYPEPQLTWYLLNGTVYFNTGSATLANNSSPCNQSEQIYTSTLRIQRGTIFPGNIPMTIQLKCGALHPAIIKEIFTVPSNDVTFAVNVYSVSLRPVGSMITAMEGFETQFECTTSAGRPRPFVRWWLGGMQLFNVSRDESVINGTLISLRSVLRLNMTRMHQSQTVYCDARVMDQPTVVESSKPVLNVWYPPSMPIVRLFPNSSFPWLENGTEGLECFAFDRGNPSSSVIWNTTRVAVKVNQQLVIQNLRVNDHGIQVQCQLQNNYTIVTNITVISETISLNVEYTPIINITNLKPPETSIVVKEGDKLNLTCTATGNPAPKSVVWLNRTSSSTLHFSDIRRQSTATYTCSAESTSTRNTSITLRSTKQVTVIVLYAPDIIVRIIDLAPKQRRISVYCNAKGVPSSYTFNSWVHKFGDVIIRSGLKGESIGSTYVLNIYNASLEDIGTYVCSATNGIMGLNGNLSQANAAYLNVTGSPHMFTEQQYVSGVIGQLVNISIQFYSYPPLSNITIKRNGILINDTGRYTWDRSSAFINFVMYNKTVQLRIEMAHFIITILKEEDFGNFTLNFKNAMGTSEVLLYLEASETRVDTHVGSIVGGVLGSVAALAVVAITVLVLKRSGFQLDHRKITCYIQSKLQKKSDNNRSTGDINEEHIITTHNSTGEKAYEDLSKDRSSDNHYCGLQDNNKDRSSSGSELHANQQEHPYAIVEVHTYDNIGHISHDDEIYENTFS